MQLSVCVLASSLLACMPNLYARSSEINYLVLVTWNNKTKAHQTTARRHVKWDQSRKIGHFDFLSRF